MSRNAVRDVYVAIADPTRREIIDLLSTGTAAANELAAAFPHLSRPAVSRHLRVLRECGVVENAREGRTSVYRLDSRPLEGIRDGWLSEFSAHATSSLRRLRRIAESDSGRVPDSNS